MSPTVTATDATEGVVVAILFIGVVLLTVFRRLQRRRPGFSIGFALIVAFSLRLLAIVAINATGLELCAAAMRRRS